MSRDLTGPRASSLAICPRRSAYEGLRIPPSDPSPRMEALFRRGRFIGEAIARDINESLVEQGRPKAIPELEIPWPHWKPVGIGHADLYVTDIRQIVEVVSTADCALPPHKAIQGAIYALNHPEAEQAVVLSIDPGSYDERIYPIDIEGLREEVERRMFEVTRALAGGPLPARARRPDGSEVEGPTEWPCFDCAFRQECWKTWEPWPAVALPESLFPDLERLAELTDMNARMKNFHGQAELRRLREKIRARMEPGVTYTGAGFTIRFVEVEGSLRFSLADAEAAGHSLPEHLMAFTKKTANHERWTIRRQDEEK